MIHELAVLNRPTPVWFYILVVGGPVALVVLFNWIGRRRRTSHADNYVPYTGMEMIDPDTDSGNEWDTYESGRAHGLDPDNKWTDIEWDGCNTDQYQLNPVTGLSVNCGVDIAGNMCGFDDSNRSSSLFSDL